MKDKKINLIKDVIKELNNISYSDFNKLDKIKQDSNLLIRKIFGLESHYLEEIRKISFKTQWVNAVKEIHIGAWNIGKNKFINILNIMIKDLYLELDFGELNIKNENKSWQDDKIIKSILTIISGILILVIWEYIKDFFI